MADSMTATSKMSKKKPAKPAKKAGPMVETAMNTIDGGDARERKWRAEDGLRTLADAERIKKDKALMADVEKERKRKMADLASISCEVSPKTIGRGK